MLVLPPFGPHLQPPSRLRAAAVLLALTSAVPLAGADGDHMAGSDRTATQVTAPDRHRRHHDGSDSEDSSGGGGWSGLGNLNISGGDGRALLVVGVIIVAVVVVVGAVVVVRWAIHHHHHHHHALAET